MSSKFILVLLLLTSLIIISCGQRSKSDTVVSTDHSGKVIKNNRSGRCYDIISDRPYNIPSQRFDQTAQALAHASGCFIETDLTRTGPIIVNAVQGKMGIRDAIKMAIERTHLKITEEGSDKIKVELID